MRKPYDLMLLFDPNAPGERRTQILSEVESTITAGGEVTTSQDWGERRMTFEIDHRPEAAYHLIQFEGEPDVVTRLSSSLRIADGLLRFRIIKIKPGTPPPTAPRPEPRREREEEAEGKVAARAAADAPADEAVAAEGEAVAPADEPAPEDIPVTADTDAPESGPS